MKKTQSSEIDAELCVFYKKLFALFKDYWQKEGDVRSLLGKRLFE
jgi:hypothetical protein